MYSGLGTVTGVTQCGGWWCLHLLAASDKQICRQYAGDDYVTVTVTVSVLRTRVAVA